MKNKIIGIRFSEEEYNKIVKEIIELSQKTGKIITISEFIRLKIK